MSELLCKLLGHKATGYYSFEVPAGRVVQWGHSNTDEHKVVMLRCDRCDAEWPAARFLVPRDYSS